MDRSDEQMLDYVTGALSPEETREFEARLARDPALADEVARLRQTRELLPYAHTVAPPPELRGKILAADRAARVREQVRPPRRLPLPWGSIAAAAALVVAVGLAADDYRLRRELRLHRHVTAMLQEPNVVRSYDLDGTGTGAGAIGRVSLDLDDRKGAIVVEGLPALPDDRVYRLWARVADADVYCGQFRTDEAGKAVVQFAVPVDSYNAPIAKLFVTAEASDEPTRPEGQPVMESA